MSVALIVAVGGFLPGFDAAVISGAVPFIKNNFQLTGTGGDLNLGYDLLVMAALVFVLFAISEAKANHSKNWNLYWCAKSRDEGNILYES